MYGPPPDDDSDDDFMFDGCQEGEEEDGVSFDYNRARRKENASPVRVIVRNLNEPPPPLDFSSNKIKCKRGPSRPSASRPQWPPPNQALIQKKLAADRKTEAAAPAQPFAAVDAMEREFANTEEKYINMPQLVPMGSAEEDKAFLQEVEQIWAAEPKQVPKVLDRCFEQVPNPYLTCLYIVTGTKDQCQAAKHLNNTLFMRTLCYFCDWIKPRRAHYANCLDDKIKLSAFQSAMKAHLVPLAKFAEAYELHQQDNEDYVKLVWAMIHEKKYNEASQCVTHLVLQQHFEIEDVVLPLLLQDKLNLVEAYLQGQRKQQLLFLSLLDEYLSDEDIVARLVRTSEVPNIKPDKLQPRILEKLSVRMIKKFNIPESACPTIINKQKARSLSYLLRQKYMENILNGPRFEELVQSLVSDNTYLQEQLLDKLVDYFDTKEACRWALFYDLSEEHLPPQVVHALETFDDAKPVLPVHGSAPLDDSSDLDSDEESLHHDLSLPLEAVHMVDTRDKYLHAIQRLSQPGTVIGIDAEWKPSIGIIGGTEKISLLQLAVHDAVFLIDFVTLISVLTDDEWMLLSAAVFSDRQVLKLGYSLANDMSMIAKSVPALHDITRDMRGELDLLYVHKQLQRDGYGVTSSSGSASEGGSGIESSPRTTGKEAKKEEKGLSDMVRMVLKRPLSKSEQMSDWGRRPLRKKQILYAALDAFCLVEIYENLKDDIQHMMNLAPGQSLKKLSAKPKNKKRLDKEQLKALKALNTPNPPAHTGQPITPGDLHVVVDTMLQGLGRHLRCCGVDVVILKHTDEHMTAVHVAEAQGRAVLTCGAPFEMLKNYLPDGRCYRVKEGRPKEQVLDVFTHFNVQVQEKDIFSRCQVCNNDDYLFISATEMKQAWLRKRQQLEDDEPPTVLTPVYGRGRGLLTCLRQESAEAASVGVTMPTIGIGRGGTLNLPVGPPTSFIFGRGRGCSFGNIPVNDVMLQKMQASRREKQEKAGSSSRVPYDSAAHHELDGDQDCALDHLNLDTLTVGDDNRPLQIEKVPEAVLDKLVERNAVCYVCRGCGKVFWEGSHYSRVQDQFQDVIVQSVKQN